MADVPMRIEYVSPEESIELRKDAALVPAIYYAHAYKLITGEIGCKGDVRYVLGEAPE